LIDYWSWQWQSIVLLVVFSVLSSLSPSPFLFSSKSSLLSFPIHIILSSPHLTSPHLTSPHLTSPHLTSPLHTSPHLTSPHLTSPLLTSPVHSSQLVALLYLYTNLCRSAHCFILVYPSPTILYSTILISSLFSPHNSPFNSNFLLYIRHFHPILALFRSECIPIYSLWKSLQKLGN
jgi:hypothetical protein